MFFKHKGLTLVEIIITTSLIAVIGLAVSSAVINGIEIWQRLSKATIEEDVHIFFEKFSADLRNSFEYKDILFAGEKEKVSFATLVAFSDATPSLKRVPGQVIYSFLPEEGDVSVEKRNVHHLYKEKQGTIVNILQGVQRLTFEYYFYDPLRKEYFWQSEWKEDNLPLAVRIRLEIIRDSKEHKFIKTFDIPLGGKEI